MDKGVKADVSCFVHLFHLCGNPKPLEDAEKMPDYCLHSTCRSDLKLNKIRYFEIYGACKHMIDVRWVFDRISNRDMDSFHLMLRGYAINTMTVCNCLIR